jgi:hypothetical protein
MCALLLPGVEVVPEHTEQQHREKQQAHTVNYSPVKNTTKSPLPITTQGAAHSFSDHALHRKRGWLVIIPSRTDLSVIVYILYMGILFMEESCTF